MENWMTAQEIAERYMVGEERLLEYGRRGNLPFRRAEGGPTLFDQSAVARIFRPRSGSIATFAAPRGAHLGVLGMHKLGDEVPKKDELVLPPLNARESRRRALRFAERTQASSGSERRKLVG